MMTEFDVVLWCDRNTPALAVNEALHATIWLDHADPNYGGKPKYQSLVRKFGNYYSTADTFAAACANVNRTAAQLGLIESDVVR